MPDLARAYGKSRYLRVTFDTRDDLVEPVSPLQDVLVVDFRGFLNLRTDFIEPNDFWILPSLTGSRNSRNRKQTISRLVSASL